MGSILKDVRSYFDTNKIAVWSMIISVSIHLLAVTGIKFFKFGEGQTVAQVEENYVDLGYQEFDEPPQIVQDIRNVEVKPDVVEETAPTDPTPVAAQEIQDQSSDVSGLNKEAPKEAPPKATVVSNTNFTDVPYYKVKPKYPKEALAQGIEGFVNLQVDILEDGSVENLKVLGGDKLNFFETEARRAVSKYKYKPFTDDTGSPMKKVAHLIRVDFKLVDSTN